MKNHGINVTHTQKIIPDLNKDYDLINASVNYFFGDSFQREDDGNRIIYSHGSRRLTIREDGSISYYYSVLDGLLFPEKELLDNQTLFNKSMAILFDLGYNISNLKLREIRNTGSSVHNSETGITAFCGYHQQKVVFDQYIDDIKIAGARGSITIYYGKGGEVFIFNDKTVKVEYINKLERGVIGFEDAFDHMINGEITSYHDEVILKSWEFVYYTDNIILYQGLLIHSYYEFVFTSLDNDHEMKFYVYTNEMI